MTGLYLGMITNILRRFVFLFLLVITVSCNSQSSSQTDSAYLTVTKVVDGDTFYVNDGTRKGNSVRLIGIDAPESRKSQHKEIGYYGKEAADYLSRILKGQKVRLEYDVSPKDRYGRTLAYVYLEDGTFLNAHLVDRGYASILTVPPNVKYADQFLPLQQNARKYKRGLWGKRN